MTIRPFAALRPKPEHAAEIAALPYDVMNTEEARQMASPLSFLHVDKAEIDLPPDTDPYSDAVYKRAAENLAKLSDGYLIEETAPCYYIYRLTWNRGTGAGTRTQTGLGALVSVAEYEQNLIKKHELTRPDKEQDRIKHILATNAHTGPIFLTYRIDSIKAAATAHSINSLADSSEPVYNFVQQLDGGDTVEHSLWVVDDEAAIRDITASFDHRVPVLYIADGHHRNEAAYKAAKQLAGKLHDRASPTDQAGLNAPESEFYLGVIFPHTDLEILDYNRVLKDLNGHTPEELLAELAKLGKLEKAAEAVKPSQKYEYGFYLPGQWYKLTLDAPASSGSVIAGLDAALLQEKVLAPLFGIADPRADKRIDFVGGIRGLAELEKRVASGEAAAFSLFPTSIEELMAVADAGEIMPPKSTWFEPKLLSGLLVHRI